ncbi:GNAT family N-acetyltransferase [Ferruginibacter sp.]|nr:GNAT family N-acetyltransferase [Ferruginibacter sp.]
MEDIIIRKAQLNDLDTLLVFEQGVIAAERPFDNTLKPGHINYYDIPKMIAAKDIELVVAESGTQIIGSGYARIENAKPYLQHTQHAYLGFMFVEKNYRGKGVNKKIINALAQWAISKNITELRLDVYQNNDAAINAYKKVGFNKHMMEMRMKLES